MMRHLRTPLVQERGEPLDLIQIVACRSRNRMDLQTWIFALEFRQGVVSLHRFLERVLGVAKTIMEFRHPIQGEFYAEQAKGGFLQSFPKLRDRSVGEVTVS